MNPHKIYLSLFACAIVLIGIGGSSWRDHVRDDARRDAVVDTQKSAIADLEQNVAASRSELRTQLVAYESERKALSASPARAADVIRELVPMQSPIQQIANADGKAAPDAPSAVLSAQQQSDLAQFAITCKECAIERDQLSQETRNQQQIIQEQTVELAAVTKASKGGSVWQRSLRIAKWGVVFGGIGYVMGRTQR
jgi:hypothetical protein